MDINKKEPSRAGSWSVQDASVRAQLVAVARRKGADHESEDAVHDALVYFEIGRNEPLRNSAYLRGQVCLQVRSVHRRRARRPLATEDSLNRELVDEHQPPTDTRAALDSALRRLGRAASVQLTAAQRAVFLLWTLILMQDASAEPRQEIAALLGLSPEVVSARLSLARKRLCAEFESEEFFSATEAK